MALELPTLSPLVFTDLPLITAGASHIHHSGDSTTASITIARSVGLGAEEEEETTFPKVSVDCQPPSYDSNWQLRPLCQL